MHVDVTDTAYLVIMTGIRAWFISQEVQSGLHASHGVHLAAQLRNEKGGHDGLRGEFEADRHLGGKSDFIDGGDILIRVDEEPFPIQGYGFDVDGLGGRRDGLIGIQGVGRFQASIARTETMAMGTAHMTRSILAE